MKTSPDLFRAVLEGHVVHSGVVLGADSAVGSLEGAVRGAEPGRLGEGEAGSVLGELSRGISVGPDRRQVLVPAMRSLKGQDQTLLPKSTPYL